MTIKAETFPYEGDLLAANAARGTHGIAYSEWSEEPRSKRGRSDRQLLMDLATADPIPHELPFRHPHSSLLCRAPIPIARQLGKSQVGFEWSEISRRLKTNGITFHRVGRGWRRALSHYAQGSGELLPEGKQDVLQALEEGVITYGIRTYEAALEHGVAPEQARFLLPQSMEALWVWTGSLLGWSELYRKRSGQDTQLETRQFVDQVAGVMAEKFPVGWEALQKR
jgi:thymidylate synthase (FAD)